jgi:predicted nucleic acid-binding protein
LIPVEITIEEFFLAQQFGTLYPRLSRHDRVALAIAKERRIMLLTGDGALRKAAAREGVDVLGTLGILDQIWKEGKATEEEMMACLEQLKAHNGGSVRLPGEELERRMAMFRKHI